MSDRLKQIEQRLAIAQKLKAKGDCAAGVRTYVMDVEPLLKLVRLYEGCLQSILDEGNLATMGKWDATNVIKGLAYTSLAEGSKLLEPKPRSEP